MTMVRMLVTGAVAMAVLLAPVACDDDKSDATPTPASTAAATMTTVRSPTPGQAATPDPDAQMVVVADVTPFITLSGDSAARARIVVLDTGAGVELSTFELEGPLRMPRPLALHGEEIHTVWERRFDAYSLDGTHLRTMVEVPDDRFLLGASLSADGRHLAYIHTTVDELSVDSIADTRLVILDVESGSTVLELSQTDERLADGFYGQMWSVWWAEDDDYVIVDPVTHSDSPSPYVAASLDGSVVLPTRGEVMQIGAEVELRGRAAIVGFQYLGSECVGPIDKEGRTVSFSLRWVDLPSGEVLGETAVPQQPYASLWAPDASAVMFARLDCDADMENPPRAWFRWAPGMAEPESVNDPIRLWREWHGDRAILTQDAEAMVLLPETSMGLYRLFGTAEPLSLVVGDSAPVGEFDSGAHVVLGFVE
jgi:hypothetical protein